MSRLIFVLLLFFTLAAAGLSAQEEQTERPWDFSLELSMMLTFNFDVEYYFSDEIGLKAGLGLAPFGLTMMTYNALVVYHLNLPAEHFQLDFEAGLPLAYFDFIEGRFVDWDPNIDDPYYGFLPGAGVLVSYRFNKEQALGLRAAAAVMFEHQLLTGWREPMFIPLFAVVYNF